MEVLELLYTAVNFFEIYGDIQVQCTRANFRHCLHWSLLLLGIKSFGGVARIVNVEADSMELATYDFIKSDSKCSALWSWIDVSIVYNGWLVWIDIELLWLSTLIQLHKFLDSGSCRDPPTWHRKSSRFHTVCIIDSGSHFGCVLLWPATGSPHLNWTHMQHRQGYWDTQCMEAYR